MCRKKMEGREGKGKEWGNYPGLIPDLYQEGKIYW
jgi:hypothetical protein